jgi:DNA-binding transcriptional LysR family regulator
MDWNDVPVFLAVLRAASLHEAADRLGVDRSTISRRLAVLEESVGERLFARTRDGLKPTAAAERVRPHAEQMEADAASLENAARTVARRAEGVVRVATTEGLAVLLVRQGLLGICDEHPDLTIDLLGANKSVDLARGEAHIALRLARLRQPSLRVRRVARMGIGLFASSSYVRTRGAARARGSLAHHDVLLPTGELSRLPEVRWLAAQPGVRVVFRSNSMQALLAAACEGRGIVPVGVPWGDSQPELERVRVLDHVPPRPLWLVSPVEALSRPAVRLVSDRIAAICAKSFGTG